MSETIHINFSRPVPLFPLPDTVLLPHTILPLHIFEPRYRQLVSHTLDQTGQLAMATFDLPPGERERASPVPLRDVVCIGQIMEHDALPDGRYNVIVQGVCRARIRNLIEANDDRAYRLAHLEPIECNQSAPEPMPEVRESFRRLLAGPRLKRLRGIDTLMEWINHEKIPTHALLELIGFTLVKDTELKYQLLAEADPRERAKLLHHELVHLDKLVKQADGQSFSNWPKGMSWN